jgi:hypothetical protein
MPSFGFEPIGVRAMAEAPPAVPDIPEQFETLVREAVIDIVYLVELYPSQPS